MAEGKKSKREWLLNRREALKLAGFAVAGAALGLPFGSSRAARIVAGGRASAGKNPYFPNLFTPLESGPSRSETVS